MPQLDVFTLYLALVAACLSVSLVWLVVARTFPTQHAAKYWLAGTLAACAGSALSLSGGAVDPLVPILLGNGLILLGSGLGWAGVRRFHGRETPWRTILGVTGVAIAALTVFTVWRDHMGTRIVIFSAAQSVLVGWAVADILNRGIAKISGAALMTAGACMVLLVLNAARTVLAVLTIGGDLTFASYNPVQSALIFLLAVFGALMCQFGFLLMTMNRLHEEMVQLAGIDDLTGAANRRYFQTQAEQECIRSSRSKRLFSLMAIDIDHFKQINDTHGHAAGDEILKLLARTAQSMLRGQDVFARLGGDEFCVLMPETSRIQAAKIANRLVAAFRDQSVPLRAATVRATLSIGVAEWSPAVGRDVIALMEQADRALYITKQHGRDGITVTPTLDLNDVAEVMAA